MANSARIDELRQKFEENPRRYFAPLANEYRKAGDLEQAIFICQEYLPQQPGHMSGHIVYGQALYDSGRYDDAKAVFETALSLDPENLIALRHLGDIARQTGDDATARGWFRRALEVDPRNEEISALVESLPGAGATAEPLAADSGPISVPPDVLASSPELRSDDSALEVERSEEAVSSENPLLSWQDESKTEEAPELHAALPPSAPAPPEAIADELLDLDDFSFEGLTAASTEHTAPGSVEELTPSVRSESADDTDSAFTLGDEDALFGAGAEAPPPAPSPDIELATDLELGLLDDGTAETTTAPPTSPLTDLETFEAGALASTPPDAPALEVDAFFDLPPMPTPAEPPEPAAAEAAHVGEESLGADALIDESLEDEATAASVPIDGGHDGQDAPETASTAGEVFVTETMAELYVQQGHLDSALDIYRKLVEQRPAEPELRDRLRAIEDRLFGPPGEAQSATASTPTPMPASTPVQGGPTIREFLSALLSSRGAAENTASGSSASNGSPDGGKESQHSIDQRPSMRATPNSGETVSGSIDALFSGAIATASDSMAAITLSDAFAPEQAETPPLQGTPAHRAEDELSLDHVFRANQPPAAGAGKDDFSFDEFFAEEANEGMSSAAGDSSSGGGAPDDIAQFNAWLNGLKKT